MLKGKIRFGKFLIIAPENPESAGDFAWMVDENNPLHFEQVWQYGSDLDMDNESPPCNQDGVAAQAYIEGLDLQRVRVPNKDEMKDIGFQNKYLCRGEKDAHFIGEIHVDI